MPRPVYGGPPIVTRRWGARGIVALVAGAAAAILAGLWGYEKMSTPVYGGPPAPVYGGPVPQPAPTPNDSPVTPPRPTQ